MLLLACTVQAQSVQIHAAVALDVEGDTDGMTRRPVVTAPNRYVWVGEVVLDLPPSSIQTIGLETDDDGATAVSLWLTDDAARAFADLTRRAVGSTLAVSYDGRVLVAPVVTAPISNGLVRITGMDEPDAQALADALRQDPETARLASDEVREPEPEERKRPEAAAPPEPEPQEQARGLPPTAVPRSPQADPLRRPAQPVAPAQPISSAQPTAPAQPVSPAQPAASAQLETEAGRVAESFVRAVAAGDWRQAAEMLHPDALEAARARALRLLELDAGAVTVRREGVAHTFEAADVLGAAPTRTLEALSARDAAALYLAAVDVQSEAGPPRRVVGEVRDGDLLHVLLSDQGATPGTSDVTVVTLARDLGVWRPLLSQLPTP